MTTSIGKTARKTSTARKKPAPKVEKTFSEKIKEGDFPKQLTAMRDDLAQRIEAAPKDSRDVAQLYRQLVQVVQQLAVVAPEVEDNFIDTLAGLAH